MIGQVIVMEPAAYQPWLQTPRAVVAATAGGGSADGSAQQTPAELGKALFTAKGCTTCHARQLGRSARSSAGCSARR